MILFLLFALASLPDRRNDIVEHLFGQSGINPYPECLVHDPVRLFETADLSKSGIFICRLADEIAAE
jgi:hypothetical protein